MLEARPAPRTAIALRCGFGRRVRNAAMRRLIIAATVLAVSAPAFGRDDGRFAGSALKPWFDGLKSGKGLCCSFADGRTVDDPDWGTEPVATADGQQVRFWVKVDGEKLAVPPEAVVTEPNRYGRAVVWPYQDASGATQIRCFIAGAQG